MVRALSVLVAALALSASTAAVAAPAPTASPAASASFASQYKPVNAQLRVLGKDIATAIQQAGKKTDLQLAAQFAVLSSRTGTSAGAVAGLKGAAPALRSLQARLATGLARTASDLASIAAASTKHDATAAGKAARSLATHYQQVGTARKALAGKLGLP